MEQLFQVLLLTSIFSLLSVVKKYSRFARSHYECQFYLRIFAAFTIGFLLNAVFLMVVSCTTFIHISAIGSVITTGTSFLASCIAAVNYMFVRERLIYLRSIASDHWVEDKRFSFVSELQYSKARSRISIYREILSNRNVNKPVYIVAIYNNESESKFQILYETYNFMKADAYATQRHHECIPQRTVILYHPQLT